MTSGNYQARVVLLEQAICGANLRRGLFECYVGTLEKGCIRRIGDARFSTAQWENDHVRHKEHARTQAEQEGAPARRCGERSICSLALCQRVPGPAFCMPPHISWVAQGLRATVRRDPRSPFAAPNLCHNKA